jgi:hypothetical protein
LTKFLTNSPIIVIESSEQELMGIKVAEGLIDNPNFDKL